MLKGTIAIAAVLTITAFMAAPASAGIGHIGHNPKTHISHKINTHIGHNPKTHISHKINTHIGHNPKTHIRRR